MAQTTKEEELKLLAQIRAMEEGDMKNRLLEAFLDQLHFSTSSKSSSKKPLYVDPSYERNTKSF